MSLKIKRGHGAPIELLKEGEPYLDLDTGNIYYGNGVENLKYVKHNGTKIYKAILTQSGVNSPNALVLENTFGVNFTWTRSNVGTYQATDDAFSDSSKLLVFMGQSVGEESTIPGFINVKIADSINTLYIYTFDLSGESLTDEVLYQTPINIILYP